MMNNDQLSATRITKRQRASSAKSDLVAILNRYSGMSHITERSIRTPLLAALSTAELASGMSADEGRTLLERNPALYESVESRLLEGIRLAQPSERMIADIQHLLGPYGIVLR